MANAFAQAVSFKDLITGEHSRAVERLALGMGLEAGLEGDELEALALGALLHDAGKIGVPDAVLGEPGPLGPEERALVERHPEIGAKILGSLPVLAPVVPAVMHHHERWDGEGYPHGLRGEAIPFAARLVAVADAFDVITRDRPYRRGVSPEAALAEVRGGSGGPFDPAAVGALLSVVERNPL